MSSVSHETVLNVSGMTCGACVRHVEKELSSVAGVQQVVVSLEAGRVTVTHGDSTAQPQLVAAVEAAGYEVVTPA